MNWSKYHRLNNCDFYSLSFIVPKKNGISHISSATRHLFLPATHSKLFQLHRYYATVVPFTGLDLLHRAGCRKFRTRRAFQTSGNKWESNSLRFRVSGWDGAVSSDFICHHLTILIESDLPGFGSKITEFEKRISIYNNLNVTSIITSVKLCQGLCIVQGLWLVFRTTVTATTQATGVYCWASQFGYFPRVPKEWYLPAYLPTPRIRVLSL